MSANTSIKESKYKRFYWKHRDRLLAKKRAAWEKYKVKALAKQKEWREANKATNNEKNRVRMNAHYHANKERINAARRAAYKANPEKILEANAIGREKRREAHNAYQREYQRINHEWMLAVSHLRRARLKGATIEPVTADDIRALFLAIPNCPYCGVGLKESNRCLDHVVPLARGGAHCVANLIPSCRTCNAQKGDKLLTEWT